MNQSLFREINERVKDLNNAFSMVLPVGEWICECANDTCVERIQMSTEEYEAVRRDGARFFVAPSHDHVLAGSQRIIERHETYWVSRRSASRASSHSESTRVPTMTGPCPSTRRSLRRPALAVRRVAVVSLG